MKNLNFKFEYFSKTIKYRGYNIETYVIGSGEKTVLSFPSFPHSGLYYLWFLDHYNLEKVRFITFDLPGWIGYSENIFEHEPFDIELYVEIAKKIVKEYHLDKFSVLGYSFGTALTLKLVHDLPSQIDRVVLVSPVFDYHFLQDDHTVRMVNILKKLNLSYLLKFYLQKTWKRYQPILVKEGFPRGFLDVYTNMMSKVVPKVILQSIYTLFHLDWSHYLDSLVNKQVMAVYSKTEDKMFHRQCELIQQKIPQDKLIHFHGHHEDFILRPQSDVVKEVVKFLTSAN